MVWKLTLIGISTLIFMYYLMLLAQYFRLIELKGETDFRKSFTKMYWIPFYQFYKLLFK
jgi:hypothetical protein